MSKLGTQIKALATESLESYLTNNFIVTKENARDIIKKLSFKEHSQITNYLKEDNLSAISNMIRVNISEANVDMARNNGTSTIGQPTDGSNSGEPLDPNSPEASALSQLQGSDELDAAISQFDPQTQSRFNRTPQGDLTFDGQPIPADALNAFMPKQLGMVDKMKQGFAQGLNSSAEQDELYRIQELAGITTSANNKSGMPSIAGNTAHTPTDRLRSKRRVKKERGENSASLR